MDLHLTLDQQITFMKAVLKAKLLDEYSKPIYEDIIKSLEELKQLKDKL